MDITRLYFGKAAAEAEVAANSERFLRTYFDRWDLSEEILAHEKFLILGPKGSGKSAASNYVALKWKKDFGENSVLHQSVDFDDLNRTQSPLASIDKKLVSGEVMALTDAAWKLFIGVRLLDSLVSDSACSISHDPQVLKFIDDLRKAGLASDDYPNVLRKVRERKGSISIPYASFGLGSHDSGSLSPGQVGDAIIKLIANAQTTNRHLLAIDGLDKAIGENDAYWRTLAALIRVGNNVTHHLLNQGNESIYVLIMCRSDVFRRANFTDAPKIAADGGIDMDWGAAYSDPEEVLLWKYLAAKAEIEPEDLWNILPPIVDVKNRRFGTLKYLLEFTRYTPRDMTELFRSIQRNAQTYRTVTQTQVRNGADSFSTRHLLHEIVSESTGLLPEVVTGRLEQILSLLPSSKFLKDDLASAIAEAGAADHISTGELGEYLFLQGAIGNYRPNSNYFQFYHRRNTAGFNPKGPWALHTGLMYALNIPYASRL